MSKMWEVDPETRAKLFQISKTNGNDRCCDCNAPSPQWASPKFGTFICLNCAGTHRGLGVHISFVRSITMDAFKNAEIQRMEKGGNDSWKAFFDAHPITLSEGRTFEDSTIKERYDGDVGEEYRDRLTAKVEGRQYIPGEKKKSVAEDTSSYSRSGTPLQGAGQGRASPTESRKERNEAYFARLGNENASRRDDVLPNQGGKYSGFGSGVPVSSAPLNDDGSVPGLNDFQKDPVAALSKGLGWFTSAVGKGAKTVNDSYIQPTAKSIAESDFAAQARFTAAQLGQNLQTGALGAADSFNRFVEGEDGSGRAGTATTRRQLEPEHKDFWDDFASLGAVQDNQPRRPSGAIGTTAMKGPTSLSSSLGVVAASSVAAASAGHISPTSSSTTVTAIPPSATSNPSSSTGGRGNHDEGGGWDDNW
ncbi:hypothetical protein V8E54_006854 [Elaphomyces granulatus]